ncbi:MAG: AAA family ATPase [Candidatus Omnitrophica bacterium]|nr:AAA family ATPase [Candidatus Omnitrophota bacterium]
MKILSFVNQKGGCGKTTSAVNLAWAISNKDYQTLLIDLDPQAHATFSLAVEPKFTTADLFENITNNSKIDYQDFADFLISRTKNLWVLGSSIGLSAIETSLTSQDYKLDILRELLESISSNFDCCVIDCPPNLGILTLNALIASNYALAPLGICELSLKGVENLNNIMTLLRKHNQKIPELFYLATQLDRRYKFSYKFIDKLKNELGDKLLSTMIRTNIRLREAAAEGKSIYEFNSASRGAQDYSQLADELEIIMQLERKETATPEVVIEEEAREIKNRIDEDSGIKLFFKGRHLNEVFVVGEFNSWCKDNNFKLKKVDEENWCITLPLKKGTYPYKFIADGRWISDPENPLREKDPFGGENSILLVK